MNSLVSYECAVCVGTAIAEELPRVAHFANLVEIEICDDERVFIAWRFGHKLPARIAEVTLPVKLTDVPRVLVSDAIDRADEITIRNCVRRLFETPQIFRQPGNCRRRIENDLSAVQPECARAFREVTVVTDVDANASERRIETRITEVTGPEVKLLP